jgi:hypothetical protein
LFPEVERFRYEFGDQVVTWRKAGVKPIRIRAARLTGRQASVVPAPGPNVREMWRESGRDRLFGDLERIELLSIFTGRKAVMRTSLVPERWSRVRNFLDQFGLAWACQDQMQRYLFDRGKGRWSNLLDNNSKPNCRGHRALFVYIAREKQNAEHLRSLEGGDDAEFGAVLGYPECCINGFKRMFPVALRHQGDLIPVIADQTAASQPWPFLLNIVTRYFGKALLSFYPCSFTCSAAHAMAQAAFDELLWVSEEDARAMRRLLAAAVLYTEYQGIYLFPEATWKDGKLRYGEVLMTTRNRIGVRLLEGERLVVGDTGHIEIVGRAKPIGSIGGANVRLLAFS